MSEKFDKLKKKIQKPDLNLEGLFEIWREAHMAEVEEIEKQIKDKMEKSNKKCEGRIFQEEVYKESTVSSHFIQFFYKEQCRKCVEIREDAVWKYVLKHAFNEDGSVGNYDIPDGGYRYIVLLKEANDSAKHCVSENYIAKDSEQLPNQWIVNWKEGEPGKYGMLYKLNRAFYKYKHRNNQDKEAKEPEKNDFFFEEMAYMNVNKRGGATTTTGLDEDVLINYAEKYRDFILKEIELLSDGKEVTVFVCGKKEYFRKLIEKLCDSDQSYTYKNIRFVSITHPSARKISAENLAKEMGK